MPLTRAFKETVQNRARTDENFRASLLSEAVEALIGGDVETGKAVLRDYINATIGFEKLAEEVGKQPKNLMQMFSAKGNPTAANLFAIISRLQEATGVHLSVRADGQAA